MYEEEDSSWQMFDEDAGSVLSFIATTGKKYLTMDKVFKNCKIVPFDIDNETMTETNTLTKSVRGVR